MIAFNDLVLSIIDQSFDVRGLERWSRISITAKNRIKKLFLDYIILSKVYLQALYIHSI